MRAIFFLAIPFPTMLAGHLIIPGGRHYIEKEGKILDNYITCIYIYMYIHVDVGNFWGTIATEILGSTVQPPKNGFQGGLILELGG